MRDVAVPDITLSPTIANTRPCHNRLRTLVSHGMPVCVLYNVLGNAMLVLLPFLIDSLLFRHLLTPSSAGRLTSALFCATAAGSAIILSLGQARYVNRAAVGSVLLLGLSFLGMTVTQSSGPLWVLWPLNGLAGGMACAAASRAIAPTPVAHHAYSLMMAGQGVLGISAYVGIPFLLQYAGPGSLMLILALLCSVAVCLAKWMPAAQTATAGVPLPDFSTHHFTVPALLLGASLFLHYVANVVLWTYAGQFATHTGLGPEGVTNALAVSLSCGIAGAMLSLCCARYGHQKLQVLAGIALIALSALLMAFHSAIIFVIGLLLMNFALMFVVPSYLSTLERAMGEGQGAALGWTCIALGMALGPACGGVIFDHEGPTILLVTCAITFMTSFFLAAISFILPVPE
ncbi:hypothetical protein H845_1030 [Komagataeibacter xylinus E25]|nr:hypothetical protein H845_1030 [Komagataeibacter xylinus E25]